MTPVVTVDNVSKSFTLHLREGRMIDVVHDVNLTAEPGECVVLGGKSGIGKSSILKMIYGNYRVDSGAIRVRAGDGTVDVATAEPRRILALRRNVIGYVSQFLRVIPRVGTLDIAAAAAMESGASQEDAEDRAGRLLHLLNLPERLWSLPPATFSGGEQQRVNLARGLAGGHPILLLDEPTASLDSDNRAIVVELIKEKKKRGVAVIGIFHDEDVRARVADRVVDVTAFAGARSAENQ